MQSASKRKVLVIALSLAVLTMIGGWYELSDNASKPPAVGGIVRTTEIRIAPEISGRIARFMVRPGQTVQRGDPLALLSNPELWAALEEACAQVDKAKSDRDRVFAGVRVEEVDSLRREIFKAQSALVLARQEFARKSVLAALSDASLQDRDVAEAEVARGEADVAVAEARYAEAKLGPTSEERALAGATVAAAEATRDVVEARAAKMLLHAPAVGIVGILVPEIGEAVVPGEPILTLIPDHGLWFGFNLREDAWSDLSVGSRVTVRLPGALEPATATISELRDWGEFAAWRAASASGDHDLNTFFLRLDPVTLSPTVMAGQTIWLTPNERVR
ncbi:MAG: efflux RND transporter periplasmic adaptor subunit [Rhodopila sp.]|jgi:HlyD family secretion protein